MGPGLRFSSLLSPLSLRVLTMLAPTTVPSNSSKVPGAGCNTPAAKSWAHSKDEPRLVLMRVKPMGQTESQRPAKNRHIRWSSVGLLSPPRLHLRSDRLGDSPEATQHLRSWALACLAISLYFHGHRPTPSHCHPSWQPPSQTHSLAVL